MDTERFLEMLDFVRNNCLTSEIELVEALNHIETDFILKHFSLVQKIVSREMENGIMHDIDDIKQMNILEN